MTNDKQQLPTSVSPWQQAKQLLRLARLYYGIPLSAGYLVIVQYLRGGSLAGQYHLAIPAFFSLLATICAGYIVNDICDMAVDAINSPGKPLQIGGITKQQAVLVAACLAALAIGLSFVCSWPFAIGVTIINSVLLFYNLYSKRLALAKNIIIAILLAGLYPLAFALVEPVNSTRLPVLSIHPLWLFFTVLGYEMLKDIRDLAGDVAMGGPQRQIARHKAFGLLARAVILIGACITLLPVFMGITGTTYLLGSLTAISLAIIATATRNIRFAIACIYTQVAIITLSSLLDL